MAKSNDAYQQHLTHLRKMHQTKYLELMRENQRLKKLTNDLQREYMNRITELAEIHPMEDK